MNEWTIEKVKEELPKVKVKIGGERLDGEVNGRLLPFAKVSVWFPPDKVRKGFYVDWEFSWQAIVNSLNSGEPLLV